MAGPPVRVAYRSPAEAAADVDRPANRHRLWSFRDWQIAYFMRRFPQSFAESRAYAAAWVAEPHN